MHCGAATQLARDRPQLEGLKFMQLRMKGVQHQRLRVLRRLAALKAANQDGDSPSGLQEIPGISRLQVAVQWAHALRGARMLSAPVTQSQAGPRPPRRAIGRSMMLTVRWASQSARPQPPLRTFQPLQHPGQARLLTNSDHQA